MNSSGMVMTHPGLPIEWGILICILMVFGFWIGLKIIQHRGNKLLQIANWQLSPMIVFISVITVFHIFLLSQPMVMRM